MKVYCSGIGGIGLSALAALLKHEGHDVSGSDRSDSALLDDLRSQGISVFLNQDGSCIPADIDLFLYSEAVPPDAPERVRANELSVESRNYFGGLALVEGGKKEIAVCGTHGKSTTTAMVAKLLIDAGKDPRVIVGTKSPDLNNRNWREGAGDFVVEACEYKRDFMHLSPSVVLMTNVDGDHFDAYGSIEEYRQAFVEFLQKTPKQGGMVIAHLADPQSRDVVKKSGRQYIDADTVPLPALSVSGRHMQSNAQLVLALASYLGIPHDIALKSVGGFKGTWRRMELKGEMNGGIPVIDDYAHHPVEIRASLQGIRQQYPDKRIVLAFQPHTHDRTKKLYGDFLPAFTDADLVIMPDIYNARGHIEHGEVDLDQFVKDVSEGSGVETRNGHGLVETEKALRAELKAGDVLVCMGAGTITSLATKMMQ